MNREKIAVRLARAYGQAPDLLLADMPDADHWIRAAEELIGVVQSAFHAGVREGFKSSTDDTICAHGASSRRCVDCAGEAGEARAAGAVSPDEIRIYWIGRTDEAQQWARRHRARTDRMRFLAQDWHERGWNIDGADCAAALLEVVNDG